MAGTMSQQLGIERARAATAGLGLLVCLAGCGGRVASQQEHQAGGGDPSGEHTDPPPCCGHPYDPPPTCFAAGTLVATPAGPRPIELIAIGEEVLGYDHSLGRVVARPVTATMRHADEVVGQLVVGDGRTIVTTPDHPFYVPSRGAYQAAEQLEPGTPLLSWFDSGQLSTSTAAGYLLTYDRVRMPVFNISVAGVENYFAEGVLVHNKQPIDECDAVRATPPKLGLVELTSWEHQQSVLALTGTVIEPHDDNSASLHHGLRLPQPGSYRGAILQQVASAARAASGAALATVPCAAGGATDEACATLFIESFVSRTYRRPIVETEQARYQELFRAALAGGDFATALGTVVEAALQSPHFLYKVELSTGKLSDFELATRLSYFLTGAPPDAELWEAANAGQLSGGALDYQIDRLTSTPQFPRAMQQLYGAWLGLDRLDHLVDDPATPAQLLQAMRDETQAFFDWHASTDVPVAALLSEPSTFIDARMSAHYGLPDRPATVTRISLDPTRYAGALTQASFMTAFPSIPQRGQWILNRLTCEDTGPRPALELPPPPGPDVERRSWQEQVTAEPRCQGCHQPLNSVGFAFESFDELGRWRSANDDTTIMTPDGEAQVKGAPELVGALLESYSVHECIMSHWLAWALKSAPEEHIECGARPLVDVSRAGGSTRSLVKAIATSSVFTTVASDAVSATDPFPASSPLGTLDTQAARSRAAQALVLDELAALRRKLPKETGLAAHEEALRSLTMP